jgi:hypothetical protein
MASFTQELEMTACRTIRQLNILLGLLVLLASQASFSAPPLCSKVLVDRSSVVTDEAIRKTIESIARLKISADLITSSGGHNRSAGGQMSITQFNKKFSELVSDLHGIKSETEIRQIISEQIAKLQNKGALDIAHEQKGRENEVQVLKVSRQYKWKKNIEIPKSIEPGFRTQVEYFSAFEKALLIDENQTTTQKTLYAFDLKTKAFEEIFQNIAAMDVSKNRGRIYAVTMTGHVRIYDFSTGETRDLSEFANKLKDAVSVDVSPSGDSLLIRKAGEVYLLGLGSGQLQEVSAMTIDGKFLNDDQVLLIGSSWGLFLMDAKLVDTKLKLQSIEIGNNRNHNKFDLSVDGNSVLFKSFDEYSILSVADVLNADSRLKGFPESISMEVSSIKPVTGNDFFAKHTGSGTYQLWEAIPREGLTQWYSFADLDSGRTKLVNDMSMDESGKHVVFLMTEAFKGQDAKIFIEVWEAGK